MRSARSEYPDRSTTLILQVDRFDGGAGLSLAGPGIAERQDVLAPRRCRLISLTGSPPTARCFRAASISSWLQTNSVAALPRSTRLGARLTMYVAVKGGERAIENAHRAAGA